MAIEIMTWAWKTKLKATLKLTLLALADYSNGEGFCWPSINSLIIKTGLARTALITNIKKLCNLGFIEKQKRYTNGKRSSNTYRLNIELSTESVRTDSERTESERTESIRTESETVGTHSEPTTIEEPSLNRHSYMSSSVQKQVKRVRSKTLIKKYAGEILNLLNEKSGRKFLPSEVNLKFIEMCLIGLMKFKTLEEANEDCRMIVVKKCREWGTDEKMHMYLRPKTLFGKTNFSQYQGELVCKTA